MKTEEVETKIKLEDNYGELHSSGLKLKSLLF
jgi:hypothetical protein